MCPMKHMSLPPLFLSTLSAAGLAVGRDEFLGRSWDGPAHSGL